MGDQENKVETEPQDGREGEKESGREREIYLGST
jgi:hypothetical protein